MKIIQSERVYIGEVEAFEIATERGITELPIKGKECITCYSMLEKYEKGINDTILGKDEKGFYITEVLSIQ